MKSMVVYFSKFGNTQKVAEAIAAALAPAGEVKLVPWDDLPEADFNGVHLVVMGSPTHKMNLPLETRPVFAQLSRKILKGKWFASFDTSYEMSPLLDRFTAGKRLARQLRNLGGKRLVPPEIFRVEGREGPLFPGEIERAAAWAAQLAERSSA